jgi:hypothetical protein
LVDSKYRAIGCWYGCCYVVGQKAMGPSGVGDLGPNHSPIGTKNPDQKTNPLEEKTWTKKTGPNLPNQQIWVKLAYAIVGHRPRQSRIT